MTATYAAVQATEGLTIQIGDGGGPEVFTHPASINQERSVEMSADVAVQKVPRTDNPAAPMKTMRQVVSVDTKVTGAGVMDAPSYKAWCDWLLSGAAKNCKISNSKTGAPILTASFVCTQCHETGSAQGELVTVQITIEQADIPVITAAP